MDPLTFAAIGYGVGGLLGYMGSRETNQRLDSNAQMNAKNQERFAREGLGWRIKDGMAHGLSRTAAAGAAPGAAFSPTDVSYQNEGAAAGNAISNIADAYVKKELQKDALAKSDLDIQMQNAQIGLVRAQTDAILGSANKASNPTGDPKQPFAESERAPMIQWQIQPDGSVMATQSTKAAQNMQNDSIGNWAFQFQRMGNSIKPPQELLPSKDHMWIKNGLFRWQAVLKKSFPKDVIYNGLNFGNPKNTFFRKYSNP